MVEKKKSETKSEKKLNEQRGRKRKPDEAELDGVQEGKDEKAKSTQLVKSVPDPYTHTTEYIRELMYRTQRHHTGNCVKYAPMRRIVKAGLHDVEYGLNVSQITEKAVLAVRDLAESATISILRQAIERREENGGKKLMEQNILNSFLNWASFQELDFVQDFAEVAKELQFEPVRPKYTQQNFMDRVNVKRPRLMRDA